MTFGGFVGFIDAWDSIGLTTAYNAFGCSIAPLKLGVALRIPEEIL